MSIKTCAIIFLIFVPFFYVGCTSAEEKKAIHLERAEAYTTEEKHPEAIIEYKNALKIDPKDAETNYKYALANLKIGDIRHTKAAFTALNDSVGIDPTQIDAQLKLGMLYLLSKDFNQAVEKGRLVIEKQPDSVEGHILLGNGLAGQQAFEPAIEIIKKALALDPKRIQTHLILAAIYVVTQDMEAAEATYKKAIETDSQSIEAHIALAGFYQSAGIFD